jgi:regulator of sirC expression with transglutaminase-like and TPR domain
LSELGALKSKHALTVRYHGANSPQARATKKKLDAEKTTEYVKRLLAKAPELSDEQRNDLAVLLKPVRKTARKTGAA